MAIFAFFDITGSSPEGAPVERAVDISFFLILQNSRRKRRPWDYFSGESLSARSTVVRAERSATGVGDVRNRVGRVSGEAWEWIVSRPSWERLYMVSV